MKTSTMEETPENKTTPSAFERQWHYKPEVPIKVSPFMNWPFDPLAAFRWVRDRWFFITENTIIVLIACLSWHYFQPPLEESKTLAFGWVAQPYLRNFILMAVVAGGLHLVFYTWGWQGKKLKFDKREFNAKGGAYTFKSQLADNMFWTLISGVGLWTLSETLMFWAMANGYAPMLQWSEHPVWFVVLLFLTPVWISFHFYWVHRFLHWPPLYKAAHGLHHRNTNVGPWSGLSMHPIEHVLFFSSVLVHFVVAAHPIHILFHMQHQALTAATSHTGFEALLVKDKKQLALGTFHHQMHHRYFECNYGNLEVPWDKWFGSFHDGTEESHEQMKARRMETRT